MKRIPNILLAILMLTSCTQELWPDNTQEDNGEKVTLSFSIDAPLVDASNDWGRIDTKSFGEMTDAKRLRLTLRLFVFDENGFLLESPYAQNKTNPASPNPDSPTNQTNFEVTLTKSSRQRRIHFVAVDTPTTFDDVVSTQYTFGSEATVMNGMTVSGTTDAYWARKILPTGISESTNLSRIPLIRNFAKFTIDNMIPENAVHKFVITGFAVTGYPSKGTVAPYNTHDGSFVQYYTGETVKTYQEISDQGYQGYQPAGVTYSSLVSDITSGGDGGLTFVSETSSIYMYETPNSVEGSRGRTALIVKGRYDNSATDTYYKVDITYQDNDNITNFYNILRNYNYHMNLNGVEFAGYPDAKTAAEMPATNNVSASIAAENVNNVGVGNRRLFVNKLYALYSEGGAKTNLTCKFMNAEGSWDKSKLNCKVLPGSDDIFLVQPTVNTSSEESDHYCHLNFTLKDVAPTPQTATIRVFVNEDQNREALFRDIVILLRNKYNLRVDCTDIVPKTANTAMNANLLVQDGISEKLFPLTFLMEAREKNIYPNSTENQLPVRIGTSIVTGSGSSFQYEKTLSYSDYSSAQVRTIDGINYKVIPCYFKTNIAASATTVYAQNEYFDLTNAHDSFVNGNPVFVDNATQATIEASDYYGVGNSYHYVDFITVRNTGTVSVTLNEGSETTTITYNLSGGVSNGDGTYKQRAQFRTKTFSGSIYSASVSYSDADFNQNLSGNATRKRLYVYIPLNSFDTNIGTNGYNPEERFRSCIVTEAEEIYTGKLNINAAGTQTVYNRAIDDTYNGFKFADGTGYHISLALHTNKPALKESDFLKFYEPDSKNNKDWTAQVTLGDLTARHAYDWQNNATEANGSATNGLFNYSISFSL